MKFAKFFSFCLFAILCCTSYAHDNNLAFAEDSENEQNEIVPCGNRVIDLAQKFYVGTDQINFSDNKIYIGVDDTLTYETPAIFSDENGYYIKQVAASGNCAWYEWKCKRCGYCNLRGIDFECKAYGCGYPISPKKHK